MVTHVQQTTKSRAVEIKALGRNQFLHKPNKSTFKKVQKGPNTQVRQRTNTGLAPKPVDAWFKIFLLTHTFVKDTKSFRESDRHRGTARFQSETIRSFSFLMVASVGFASELVFSRYVQDTIGVDRETMHVVMSAISAVTVFSPPPLTKTHFFPLTSHRPPRMPRTAH